MSLCQRLVGICRIHLTITASISDVKWGLPTAHFIDYNLSSCFSTVIFLKFRILLIILVKQIYMVALKVPRKWPLKLGNNCNLYTGDPIQ